MNEDRGLCIDCLIQAVDNSPVGTVFVSLEGLIVNVNRAACGMLGYASKDIKGMVYRELVDPEDADELLGNKNRLLRGEIITYKTELRLIHKLGRTIWASFTMSAVRDNLGTIGFIVYLIDLTEQKRADRYNEALIIQSEKLSMAGQLAAGIAHEIRNPMTSIKGFFHLIRTGKDKKDQYFDIISEEIERIELILGELLLLAKPQSISYARKDIRMVLEQVITLLNTQAILNNVEIVTEFDQEPAYAECDVNQIKQVFINFIKNAVEAMPGGGSMTIRLDSSRDEELAILIIDEGCGMPESLLSRLGEPFYSTKDKGTGLGFMISKKLIEDHRGRVAVASELGQGTTVEVYLPRARKN